jgi:O-antigen/teichoic acid export membrane protein
MVARLKGDRFLGMAGVLVGGTASAQLIAVVALPLLTRLYSAEHFSVLAIYVAILTLIGSAVCMRLEAAIPLPEDDDDALRLLVLSLLSVVGVTLVLGLAVALLGKTLAQSLGRGEIAPYLWLVPIGAAMIGTYSAFQYMAMREKAFGLIARTRLMQALTGLGAQLGLGLLGFAPVGLLIGHALMSGAGVIALARRTLRPTALRAPAITPSRLVGTLQAYRKFPQYSVAEELANNAGIQLPIVLIGLLLVGPEAGFLFLAMRVIGMPLAVVGGAVSQVYYSNAAEFLREGRLAEETVRVVERLSNWIVLPLVLLGPFAPKVFHVAFGQEWERAGVLLVWMLPWYVFRLISSPISMVMHVKMRQPLMLALTLAGLLIRVAPISVVLVYRPQLASITYALTSAIFYAGLSVIYMSVAGVPGKNIVALLGRTGLKWGVAGVVALSIARVI